MPSDARVRQHLDALHAATQSRDLSGLKSGGVATMKAMSLGYHDVTDGSNGSLQGYRALYKLDREDFRKHMQCLRDRGQGVAVRCIDRYKEWKGETPAFLTFDDGELGSYNCVAPELEFHGWRGHFFITTDWIGRPGFMGRGQIRELHQRGHVIGSHSCTHPSRMSKLGCDELMKEWSTSCAILSDILGQKVRVASVPDGYYSRQVGEAAAAAGIEVLFTSEATATTSVLNGCLILGRYFVQIHTPPATSSAIAAGDVWPRLCQALFWQMKKPVKALTGKTYFTIRRYLISQVLR